MTPEQQKALALAAARRRRAEGGEPPADPQFQGGQAGAFGLGAANTASFGLGDELGAGLGAVSEYIASKITGEPARGYDELLGTMRTQDKTAQAENPWSYGAGQVAGGVGTGIGAARTGIGLLGAAMPQAGNVARIGAGIGSGALMGGAYGFGQGEGGFGPRMAEAGTGAAIGAAVGGAIPAVGATVSSAYRAGADYLAERAAAQGAGTTVPVARELTRVLQADQSLGPRGAANMARAGNEAMLADAGPNAMQALDTAIQAGGPATTATREAIEGRTARDAIALNLAMDNALGAPQGVQATRTAIREEARPALDQVYRQAYAQPIDYASQTGQRLEGMVRNRVPQGAIQRANELMRVNGEESRQILARVGDDGNVTFETMPDVRQLDYITRGLRQLAESGEGQGSLGGQTQLGASYQNLAREIRSTLRDAVPEYGQALDTAADPISRSQAVQFGSRLLSPSVTRDEVTQTVQGMSQAERAAAAQGIRSNIDDQVANVQRAVSDGNMQAREAVKALKLISSRASRDKLSQVIGDDAANTLFDEVDRAAQSFNLRAGVADNSSTFTRQALDQGIDAAQAPNAVQLALMGKFVKAPQQALAGLQGQAPQQLVRGKQDMYSQIADILTRQGGEGIDAFNAMTNLGGSQQANQQIAQSIAQYAGALQPAVYPVSTLSTGNMRR